VSKYENKRELDSRKSDCHYLSDGIFVTILEIYNHLLRSCESNILLTHNQASSGCEVLFAIAKVLVFVKEQLG
jgi:hypothetical protein